MNQFLAHITLVVDDYDKAIAFYTQKLHFSLVEDTPLSDTKRWVLVRPQGAKECSILLAKAANEAQLKSIGNQTGGRVSFFLYTDNLKRDHQNLIHHQIKIIDEPRTEAYGSILVFQDMYGNLWDLIEPTL
jgi:catechol 2,3-dioxygenase-like lactoylglutathione lyase family enzyme